MAKSKKKAASHKAKKPAARNSAKATKKAVKRPSASKAKPKHSRSARPKAGRARTSESPAEIFRDNNKPRRLDPFTKAQKQKLLQLRDAMVDSMAGVAQDTLRSRAEGSEASAFGMHQADAGSDAYDRDFALSLLSQEQDALYEIRRSSELSSAPTAFAKCRANKFHGRAWKRFHLRVSPSSANRSWRNKIKPRACGNPSPRFSV